MSSFGFMTRSGEKRVSGREYLKLGSLLHDTSWSALAAAFEPHTDAGAMLLRRAFSWPDWVTDSWGGEPSARSDFLRWAKLCLRTESPRVWVHSPSGRDVANAYEVGINSACAGSSDSVALAVRIYGQAEVNAWVAGEDRLWLAKVIEEGLAEPFPAEFIDPDWDALRPGSRLFSDDAHWKSHYDGWAAAVEMLRESDRETVVLDYSVIGGFPDQKWATHPGRPGKRFRRWWDQASPEQHWDSSERGLRKYTAAGPTSLRIQPEGLCTPGFGQTEAWTWDELAEAWRSE